MTGPPRRYHRIRSSHDALVSFFCGFDIGIKLTTAYLSFLDQCDGVILGTAEAYEREAISHITEWYAETSREVYVIGHLLPLGENAAAGEQKQSENSTEISAFLQKTLETDGPDSLIYVSGFPT